MSQQIFVQAFEAGEPQNVPTTEILECFQPYIFEKGDGYIKVVFDPQESSTVYFAIEDETDCCVMLDDPCGSPLLAKCLFKLMEKGHFVLFSPGEEGFVVRDERVISHMPEEMRESLGGPRVMVSEDEFMVWYQGTSQD